MISKFDQVEIIRGMENLPPSGMVEPNFPYGLDGASSQQQPSALTHDGDICYDSSENVSETEKNKKSMSNSSSTALKQKRKSSI